MNRKNAKSLSVLGKFTICVWPHFIVTLGHELNTALSSLFVNLLEVCSNHSHSYQEAFTVFHFWYENIEMSYSSIEIECFRSSALLTLCSVIISTLKLFYLCGCKYF